MEDVHLGYNHINDHGIHALAQALKRNSALKRLHLEGNDITDVGALELLDALHHNLALSELYIRSNRISEPIVNALAKLVAEGAKRAPWGHERKREKTLKNKRTKQDATEETADSKLFVKKAPPTRAPGQPDVEALNGGGQAYMYDAEL